MTEKTERKKITARDFAELKGQRKLACVTCYDYTSALLVDRSNIDAILVGDSASNTMAGHPTTLPITLDQMIYHVQCVTRAVRHCFVMGDMPFGTVHGDPYAALQNAIRMMKEGGCDAVKVEGGREVRASLEMILGANIPVVGHLGLTPQSIHRLGGYGLQAREEAAAERLLEDARMLDEIGVTAITLEKIPAALAKRVTEAVSVPTIGIGAGPDTDAQILVMQDMLGMTEGFRPKFLRRFGEVGEAMVRAFDDYAAAVAEGSFPDETESY